MLDVVQLTLSKQKKLRLEKEEIKRRPIVLDRATKAVSIDENSKRGEDALHVWLKISKKYSSMLNVVQLTLGKQNLLRLE